MERMNKLVMKSTLVVFVVLGLTQLFATYLSAKIGGRYIPGTNHYSVATIGFPCDNPVMFAGTQPYCYCDVTPMYGALILTFAYFAYKAIHEHIQEKPYFDLVMIYAIGQIVIIALDFLKGYWTWWVMILLFCYATISLLMIWIRKKSPNDPHDHTK
jgi:hypothetical protein